MNQMRIATSLAVARRLVMFLKRSGGQPQVSAHLTAQFSAKPTIQQIREWVLDNLAADHSIEMLERMVAAEMRLFWKYRQTNSARTSRCRCLKPCGAGRFERLTLLCDTRAAHLSVRSLT
jgi:transcriptional regulator GlxA family with amidase domain